jgi:hypothetical protein
MLSTASKCFLSNERRNGIPSRCITAQTNASKLGISNINFTSIPPAGVHAREGIGLRVAPIAKEKKPEVLLAI